MPFHRIWKALYAIADLLRNDSEWYSALVRVGIIVVLLVVSLISILLGLSELDLADLSHGITVFIQFDLLTFLILFCLSWGWNGLNELGLLKNSIRNIKLAQNWWYQIYVLITSLFFSLLLMILFIAMFAFSQDLQKVATAASLYTVVDISSWYIRRSQILRLTPGSDAITNYYLHTPHICRLAVQLVASLIILLISYYVGIGDDLSNNKFVAPSYIGFLLCIICSEATIQCWRMDMKINRLNELIQGGDTSQTANLDAIIIIDKVFKAWLYLLFLFTVATGAIWVAGFVTENFSYGLEVVYGLGGRKALVVTALLSGILAYLIRLFYRLWYGVCEVLIGMFIIYNSAPIQWTDVSTPDTIKIASGIFVIIRGLDSGYEGFTKYSWSEDRITKFGRWRLVYQG
jgi:hypothetical protein